MARRSGGAKAPTPVLTELAWCAGFFDGEGSTTTAANHYGTRRLHLTIGQSGAGLSEEPPETLLRFQRALGGLLHRQARKSPGGRSFFILQVQNYAGVQQVVAAMWPWLSQEKRDQASAAFTRYHDWRRGMPERRRQATVKRAARYEAEGRRADGRALVGR